MGIERKMFRGMFAPMEVVLLKQPCFTPGGLFEPGKYPVQDLPDIAFDMGLVQKLPTVRQSQEVSPPDDLTEKMD
jgi:hypothetical protein